jgi:meso-butanediol dehydrogenase / (S,S)-butanediol dehydrogenase / diacetyl reductase
VAIVTERFSGKIALISGAGGGKGLALTKLLVAEGATVFVSDRDLDRVRGIAEKVGEGDRVRPLKLDVTQEADWVAAAAEIKKSHGLLNILINTARIYARAPLADVELAQWRAGTAVILDGAFLGMKHAIPLMIAAGGGSIVNILSAAGIRPVEVLPNYNASNAAAINLTSAVAVDYGPQNIRANAVVCGFSDNSPVGDAHELAKRIVPLQRPANAMDIARAALWLASDDSSYCTGSSLVVDGGLTAFQRF